MNRNEIVAVLRAHASELKARGVARLMLFGSTARGDAGPESDVDVAVDIAPGRKFSLIDLAGLRVHIRDLVGQETDVVVREDLRPRMRAAVEADAVEVF